MPNTYKFSAPGRCGILGNPSDIYGGRVISASIPARNTCTLIVGGNSKLPEDTRLWDAATARFPIFEPVEVIWETQVPRSSGLAGSTALLAATLACVLTATGNDDKIEDRRAFAELVRDVERNEAGVMCGYQDAYMVVHGGIQFMDFAGKHPVRPGPFATLTPLDVPLPFLLVSTGVERLSGAVHGPMVDRWLAGEDEVVDGMMAIALAADHGRERLANGDISDLMKLNQIVISALGGSGEAIDILIGKCVRHGAQAAKLAGAGMGGTILALTDDPDALEARLRAEGYSRFLRPIRAPGLRREH